MHTPRRKAGAKIQIHKYDIEVKFARAHIIENMAMSGDIKLWLNQMTIILSDVTVNQ